MGLESMKQSDLHKFMSKGCTGADRKTGKAEGLFLASLGVTESTRISGIDSIRRFPQYHKRQQMKTMI